MELHRHEFERVTAQGRQLAGHCDEQTSSKINELTQGIQQQWSTIEHRLREITESSREVVDQWRQFNSSYVNLLDRLGELEGRWYTIQREKFSSDTQALVEKVNVSLFSKMLIQGFVSNERFLPFQDFQERLQQLDVEMTRLSQLRQQLARHLPATATKKIDTQYTVIDHQYAELCSFHKKLLQDCVELKQRETIYLEQISELTQTINQTESVLKSQQLTDDNERDNLQHLHDMHALLRSKRDLIERLSTNEFIPHFQRAKHFHEVLSEYAHALESVQSRIQHLESNQYNKLNFDKRCRRWNDYIQAIEQNLSMIEQNLHTNYQGLLEIDVNLSNTVNDFNQRQHELFQLVNEGKKLIEQGVLTDQQTFGRLEHRWQTIMRTVLEKQQEVKHLIKLWISYQNSLDNYYRLLKAKYDRDHERMHAPTMLVINQIKQGSHARESDNGELKVLLERIYESNRKLHACADAKTQAILDNEWSDLQKSGDDATVNIKQRSDALMTVRRFLRLYSIFLQLA